jgi:hypothetical protein
MMDPEDLLFDPYADLDVHARNLPQWRQEGKLYFVTWRQSDSIPTEKRDELRRERDAFIIAHGDPSTTLMSIELQRRYHQRFNERVQQWLDAGVGSCVLRDQRACSCTCRPLGRPLRRRCERRTPECQLGGIHTFDLR